MHTLDELLINQYNKIVLSKPTTTSLYKKIVIKRLNNSKTIYQAEQFTATQVLHKNFDCLNEYLSAWISSFREIYLFGEVSYAAFLKNGEITRYQKIITENNVGVANHNKEKNYLIPEGSPIPVFVKLGIFTKDYKVVAKMHDKFKQINRYLELLSDIIKEYKENDDIHIVDFGCGKSYLSFAVYYYLSVIKKLNVFLIGIDLKKEVVEDCKKLAEEYGYSGMGFFAMDIKDFVPKQKIDLVISLHACDIATDFVIHQAVKAGAKHIFSVPCCQKEINKHIANSYEPILFRYGILQERVSALITDAIRATVLELNGYKTDISEFVDLTDSPKNLLIRASLAAHSPSYLKKKREELNDLLVRVDAIPMIVKLLG